MIKKLPLNRNGHVTSPRGDTVEVMMPPEGLTGEIPEFMRHPQLLTQVYDCWNCGEILETEILAEEVKVTTSCTLPDGITTTIRLEVPSGKIIVTDDLRPVYNGFSDSFASYNTAMGQAQVVEEFARQGCAFGPVGNSCPTLYRTGDGTYVIASPDYDEDTNEPVLPDGWEPVTWICTDLWAYSIADYDDWASKGGAVGDWNDRVIDIPAGTYEFTHHAMEKGFDGYAEGTVVYADIRKIA